MKSIEELQEEFDYLQQFLTDERLQKINHFAEESSDFVLPVMEDIYQFRNAAAIVRSVEACGFHKIVALQDKNVFHPNLKVTKGADTWVEVERMQASQEALQAIKKRGYRIVAVSPEREATMLPDFEITQPIALVFGTEWQGVSDGMLQAADETLAIPMYGFTKSFNVSVAAAICMYDLKQKLLQSNLEYKLPEDRKLQMKIRWAIHSIRSGEEIYERYLALKNK